MQKQPKQVSLEVKHQCYSLLSVQSSSVIPQVSVNFVQTYNGYY